MDRFGIHFGSIWGAFGTSKSVPNRFQNRSKIKLSQHTPTRPLQEVPRVPQDPPRGLKIAPRGLQDPPERLPRGSKDCSRPLQTTPGMPQDGPKRYHFSWAPRSLQHPPRGPNSTPRAPQRFPRFHQETPRRPQETQKNKSRSHEQLAFTNKTIPDYSTTWIGGMHVAS